MFILRSTRVLPIRFAWVFAFVKLLNLNIQETKIPTFELSVLFYVGQISGEFSEKNDSPFEDDMRRKTFKGAKFHVLQ